MKNENIRREMGEMISRYEQSIAYKTGACFSEYLYDFYSEYPHFLPEGYKDADLEEACYSLAGLVDME